MFTAGIFIANIDAAHSSSAAGKSEQLIEFYALMRSFPKKTHEEQVNDLRDFILKHPLFQPAYEQVLEHILMHSTPDEAIKFFQNLKAETESNKHHYWMLAKAYYLNENYGAADSAFAKAMQRGADCPYFIRDLVSFEQSRQTVKGGKSLKHKLNSDLQKVYSAWLSHFMQEFEEVIANLAQLPPEYASEPSLLYIWGESHLNIAQPDKAFDYWKRGTKISEETADVYHQALFEMGYGYAAIYNGEFVKAHTHFGAADSLSGPIQNFYLKQMISGRIGLLHNLSGEYEDAIRSYEEAEKISRKIGASDWLFTWLFSHAQILFVLGKHADALDVFEQCDLIASKLNFDYQKIELNIRKSSLYNYLGHNNYAREILKEARNLAKQIKRKDQEYFANALLSAIDLDNEENYAAARVAFENYLSILGFNSAKRSRAYWIALVAETYEKEKRFDDAKREYRKAIQLVKAAGSKYYELWYRVSLAKVEVTSGNYLDGITEYENVITNPMAQRSDDMLYDVYIGLGDAYQNLANFEKAIYYYRQAALTNEEAVKQLTAEKLRISYFSRIADAYHKLVDCYFLSYVNDPKSSLADSMFYYLQRSQARTFSDIEVKKDSTLTDPAYLQAVDNVRAIQRRLRTKYWELILNSKWGRELAKLSAARLKLLSERLKFSSFVLQSNQVPTLDDAFRLARNHDLGIIFYHLSNDASFTMAVLPDTIHITPLETPASIVAAMVDSLIQPLHNAESELETTAPYRAGVAYDLYKLIFEPLRIHNELPDRLMIIPDTPLLPLPFEMLLTQEPDKPEYTVLDDPSYASYFLQKDYSISYVPSITLLEEYPKPIADSLTVFIFSDPELKPPKNSEVSAQLTLRTGWRFSQLFFAKDEANAIREVYSGSEIFDRKKATKQQLRDIRSGNDIIHFATHAFADTTFDEFSGLVLSIGNDPVDDGILMGYEISDLSLPAELITMSACETGRGQIVPGEGVLGLPRLFWKSGAKSVLMTHWKVDDEFASQLMPSFYSYLFKEGLSKADALSFAKREILENMKKSSRGYYYQHPFFWASFTMYGDPGMEKENNKILVGIILGILVLVLFLTIYKLFFRRHVLSQK